MNDLRTEEEKERWKCLECKKDTFIENKDYYMIKNHLWLQVASDPKGMMCWSCVEEKLGRDITADDLTDCPLNTMFNNTARELLFAQAVSSVIKEVS